MFEVLHRDLLLIEVQDQEQEVLVLERTSRTEAQHLEAALIDPLAAEVLLREVVVTAVLVAVQEAVVLLLPEVQEVHQDLPAVAVGLRVVAVAEEDNKNNFQKNDSRTYLNQV